MSVFTICTWTRIRHCRAVTLGTAVDQHPLPLSAPRGCRGEHKKAHRRARTPDRSKMDGSRKPRMRHHLTGRGTEISGGGYGLPSLPSLGVPCSAEGKDLLLRQVGERRGEVRTMLHHEESLFYNATHTRGVKYTHNKKIEKIHSNPPIRRQNQERLVAAPATLWPCGWLLTLIVPR